MNNGFSNGIVTLSRPNRPEVKTIFGGVFTQRSVDNIRYGSKNIRQAQRLIGLRAGLNLAGPFDKKRFAVAAFKNIGLHAAPIAVGAVPELVDFRLSPVGSVVGSENYERIFG